MSMPVQEVGQVQGSTTAPDGVEIAWWATGRGRPLVLVHGTTADHTRWAPVTERLGVDALVCAVDRRGRGASGDAEDYDIEREYDDVAAVVDALAGQSGAPVDLFGHSYGALCSLEATLRGPNVRKLVLYEPPVLFDDGAAPPDVVERMEALLAAGERDELLATFFRDVVRMPEHELDRARRLPAWQGRVAAAHTLLREERASAAYQFDPDRFTALAVPTLMLLGSDSPPFLQSSTEAVAAALPDARVEVLAGQQHVAIDTAPDLVSTLVLDFLAEPGS